VTREIIIILIIIIFIQLFVYSTMVFLRLKLRFSSFPYVIMPSSVSLWLVIVCFTTTILLSWGRPFLRLPIDVHSRILEFVNPSLYISCIVWSVLPQAVDAVHRYVGAVSETLSQTFRGTLNKTIKFVEAAERTPSDVDNDARELPLPAYCAFPSSPQ
jgi:hypothetical protein